MSYAAAVLTRPGQIEMTTRDDLTPGPNEVRIQLKRAGICGTDIAVWKGDYEVPMPIVAGHEFAGNIDAVGEDVEDDLVGLSAVAEINNTCRARHSRPCPACEAGLGNHCLERTVTGIIRADGAFAEQIIVPADNVHCLPEGIDFDEATFVEPLAAALQTFEISPPHELAPSSGQPPWVVLLGVGRLGALICLTATALGCRVIAVARSDASVERAGKFGARYAIRADTEDPGELIRSLKGGLGADMVIDATGSPEGLPTAVELVRPKGVVHIKTTCGETASIDATRIVVDEIQIHTSRCGPFGKAIDLLAKSWFDVKPLIEARYPLGELTPALEHASETSGKILIGFG